MAQCEPMTSYHYTGNEIDGAGVPEWGRGYPDVDGGNLEGGAKRRSSRRARKSQRKGRKSQRKSTKRRVNNVRRSRRSSKRRVNNVRRSRRSSKR